MDDPWQRQGVNEITKKIIGCAYQVSNTLGIGKHTNPNILFIYLIPFICVHLW